ncbi:Mitochondrial carrier protein LEU5 [Fulvia fulva]|uniref:Mitochondrial thiamine pyrophosphate carrier 1 n=1 Tax=Passalora fulva TaxID=5499 RepID=A0A9Q8USB4_PASFU|nr:Mitochondrial carrier protein LEU5 [Fulvia fulva]KAK4617526.1 Mitochondrial carrier protein LEU5 [Fulvia fulva]KAK4619039.1 Mitochondrial carrier protein LEU5 [Fulvia fulva]UJO20664.1 Mitochondrial carrier protein LEU5 [Fulvia fulva]WPV18370.1 Mitochondrial carrier protein LEU5 [Fulvia fulva]WPV33326.1 Mitochondrial carrier protein LEU5 [Fulvia fulva]
MSSFASGPTHNVTPNTAPHQPHDMTPDSEAIPAKEPAICPTDTDNLIPSRKSDGSRPIQRQSVEYAVRSGIAGGIAACAAKTVVAPLDRVKILFQANNPQFQNYTGTWSGALKAMRDIYLASGPSGLFRGHSATLLRIFPYGGIKFLAYEQIRAVVIPEKAQETHARRFAVGASAGLASVFITYPLEVIRVRLAWETKSTKRMSVRDVCKTIYNEHAPLPKVGVEGTNLPKTAIAAVEATQATIKAATPSTGLGNFYRGFTPTVWGMLPYAGASFLTHDAAGDFMRLPRFAQWTLLPMSERSQKQLAPGKPAPLVWWAELITGAVAGFVSQTVSYPLEVIRRRMQVGGVVGDGHRLTMIEVARSITRERGFRGFFTGLGIGYVKVVPMAATSFYVYERMKVVFGI